MQVQHEQDPGQGAPQEETGVHVLHAHHHLGGPVDGGIAVASPQSIDVCAAFVASPSQTQVPAV
jgi:hypothetical protein